MFIVAVTGGIATGKSTVSKVFERHGIPVIDADKIAREIVEPGQAGWEQIRAAFGEDVLLPSKEINRPVLARMIFEDKELRGKLNQITHPKIHRKIFWQAFKLFVTGHSWIVLDLPLLFETGILMDFIYKIVCVSCDSDKQLQRLIARNELSEADASHRIKSQMPLEKKCEQSHFVIDNNGSVEETEESAIRIVSMMKESKQHWRNRVYLLGLVMIVGFTIYMLLKIFSRVPDDI
ncbi:dephospho-CoA kinase [Drosophila obscura]|uniref:dephospho-CoA kinase n=1 Tax=Drosophila obscura TaxID=7282 RepID=UPI000BA0C05A|nr:dephospho-CoA kinase [Drosophila obscura]